MANRHSETRTAGALSNRLAKRRHTRVLTQAGLAAPAGVSGKTVNKVERGLFVPSTILGWKQAIISDTSLEKRFWRRFDNP